MKKLHKSSRMALILLCMILCVSLFASCGGKEDASVEKNEPTVEETELSTKPTVEETEPTVVETEPTVEETEPTVEETEPTVEETEPTVEETEPTVVETEPTVEETEPTVEETEPTVEETEPTVEETEPTAPPSSMMQYFDYTALNFDEYITLDLSILNGMEVEVYYAPEITEEELDLAIIEVLYWYEATEITKEIAEDYMGVTLPDGTDHVAALRDYLRIEKQEMRDEAIHSEVVYEAWIALTEAVVYKKLPTEAIDILVNETKAQLEIWYLEEYPDGEISFEEYICGWYDIEDLESFDLDAVLREDAEETVKEELIFYYVATQKGLIPSDEETAETIRIFCEEAAKMQNEMDPEANATAESIYQMIVELYGEDFFKKAVIALAIEEKIDAFLYKSCKVVFVTEPDNEEESGKLPEQDENSKEEETEPEIPTVDLDEYENPVLLHTPVLDGVLDPEYKKSYHFDNEQYTEIVSGLVDENGDPIYDAYSNRSTTYILWDGDFIYVAIERWDDDLLSRSEAYIQEPNAKGDINPWYNDTCEVWYNFELVDFWTKNEEMCKVSYDAFGLGDVPFSAVSEQVYSNHFLECEAAAKAYLDENPGDEEGFVHLSVLEFKIPAKTEGGDELLVDDFIWIAIQVDDLAKMSDEELIAAGYDPATFEPSDLASDKSSGYTTTWTRARTVFPNEAGEYGGFGKGYLTDILPSQVADPE